MYFKEAFIYITGVALCINITLTLFYFCTGAQFSTDLFGMHFLTQQLATMLCLIPAYPFMRKKRSNPKDKITEAQNEGTQKTAPSFEEIFQTPSPVLYRSASSPKELEVVIYGDDHKPAFCFKP